MAEHYGRDWNRNEQADWHERDESWRPHGSSQHSGFRGSNIERSHQMQRDYVFGGQQSGEYSPADVRGRMHARGPKGYRRSDARIREDVCERLMMSDLDVSDVSVEVKDGRVILEGTVPERRMKHAIEDTAEQCFGVHDVDNNIRVARSAFMGGRTGESGEVAGLNRCLRSELSAIETYRQALDRDRKHHESHREFQQLSEMLREHEDSAARLREAVLRGGGEPSTDSGAWGTWSKIVMGAAKLLGDKAALKALKEGEESGFDEYARYQRESQPSVATRDLTSELMARQQRHIRELESLMAAAERG